MRCVKVFLQGEAYHIANRAHRDLLNFFDVSNHNDSANQQLAGQRNDATCQERKQYEEAIKLF